MEDKDKLPAVNKNAKIQPYTGGEFDEEILKSYPPSMQKQLKERLDDEDRAFIKRGVGDLKHGAFADVPLLCRGVGCPYAEICPLHQKNVSPADINPKEKARCPIEITAINAWSNAWVEALSVDVTDFSEVYMIRELVEAEIMQMRANKYIALEGFVKEIIVKTDPVTQEAYVNYDIAVPLEVKLKFKNLIYKILDKFIATREAKTRWGLERGKTENDRFKQIAELIRSGKGKEVFEQFKQYNREKE